MNVLFLRKATETMVNLEKLLAEESFKGSVSFESFEDALLLKFDADSESEAYMVANKLNGEMRVERDGTTVVWFQF